MIKLIDILREIKVNRPSPLNTLLSLQSRIKTSDDPKEQFSLAIQCAERVLFIYEEKFPNDDRPRKAIEAAKVYLADPTKENIKAARKAGHAAFDAAAEAEDDAASDAAAAADVDNVYAAAAYAIYATKEYYNLSEIKVNKPSPLNTLLSLQSRIKASDDPMEKLSLAIQCAEKVLYIWEGKYPTDKRLYNAIKAAKAYLTDPSDKNKENVLDAAYAAYAAASAAEDDEGDDDVATVYAADAAAYAANAVYYINDDEYDEHGAAYAANAAATAVEATKKYYNLK